MTRLRLLDLYCKAGGASMGYHLAGFDVTGVDIEPQPRYPFTFVKKDALEVLADKAFMSQFQAIAASPPCHDHTDLASVAGTDGTGWLLHATIDRLTEIGVPYVVENVPGAKMPGAYTLCGRSFGIPKLKRHRQFLTNFPMLVPPCACTSRMRAIGIYGDLAKNDRPVRNSKDGYIRMRAGVQTARDLLGCQWMEAHELTQAIPPVYTRFIGEQLLAHIGSAVPS